MKASFMVLFKHGKCVIRTTASVVPPHSIFRIDGAIECDCRTNTGFKVKKMKGF
jgi:hypothetical protein